MTWIMVRREKRWGRDCDAIIAYREYIQEGVNTPWHLSTEGITPWGERD